MSNMVDWILNKMRLGYTEEELEVPDEAEPETVPFEKAWLEFLHWKKEKVPEGDSRVYFKVVQSYADCKQVIDTYKGGSVCIYSLDPASNPDAQGMMNYLCGGLYALDGDVTEVGRNTFMTVAEKLEE